jgi:hypothetical protein
MEEVLAVLKFESLPRPISVFSSGDGKALDNLNARAIAAAVINLSAHYTMSTAPRWSGKVVGCNA